MTPHGEGFKVATEEGTTLLATLAVGFIGSAERDGYDHPKTRRAYGRLRGAWQSMEHLTAEDRAEDDAFAIRHQWHVIDGGEAGERA
jgi:hypothetical protein